MKKYLLLLITISSFMLIANDTFYAPDNHFPLEFLYLTNSIQIKKLTSSELNKFKSNLILIDNLARHLDQPKMHFFIKSEIYKTLFKYRPKNEISLESYNPGILSSLKKRLEEDTKKDISPFTTWFLEALLSDLEKLFQAELFKSVQNAITSRQSFKNDKEKIFKKKLDLSLGWIELYMNLNAEEFEAEMSGIMLRIMEKIQFQSQIYLKLTNAPMIKNDEKLVHFNINQKTPDKKGIAQINYILDMENMGLDKDRQQEPKLEWLPKDEPDNISYPIEKGQEDPGQKSASPPKPINDWPIDIE